jgi:hypothetical protein
MGRTVLFGCALLLCACAAQTKTTASTQSAAQRSATDDGEMKGTDAHPIFIGHGTDGEVVMAATHYDSMNGLAMAPQEIGIANKDDRGDIVCKREVWTGTHLPQWVCRYQAEVEQDRMRTRNMLDRMPSTCAAKACRGD